MGSFQAATRWIPQILIHFLQCGIALSPLPWATDPPERASGTNALLICVHSAGKPRALERKVMVEGSLDSPVPLARRRVRQHPRRQLGRSECLLRSLGSVLGSVPIPLILPLASGLVLPRYD